MTNPESTPSIASAAILTAGTMTRSSSQGSQNSVSAEEKQRRLAEIKATITQLNRSSSPTPAWANTGVPPVPIGSCWLS